MKKETFSRQKNEDSTKSDKFFSILMAWYFFFNVPIMVGPIFLPFSGGNPSLGLSLAVLTCVYIWLTYFPVIVKQMSEEKYSITQVYKFNLSTYSAVIRLKNPLRVFGLKINLKHTVQKNGKSAPIPTIVSTKDSTEVEMFTVGHPTELYSSGDTKIIMDKLPKLDEDGQPKRVIKEFHFNADNPFSKLLIFFRYKAFFFVLAQLVLRKNLEEYAILWLQTGKHSAILKAAKLGIPVEKTETLLKLGIPHKEYESFKDLPTSWIYKTVGVEEKGMFDSSPAWG